MLSKHFTGEAATVPEGKLLGSTTVTGCLIMQENSTWVSHIVSVLTQDGATSISFFTAHRPFTGCSAKVHSALIQLRIKRGLSFTGLSLPALGVLLFFGH